MRDLLLEICSFLICFSSQFLFQTLFGENANILEEDQAYKWYESLDLLPKLERMPKKGGSSNQEANTMIQ